MYTEVITKSVILTYLPTSIIESVSPVQVASHLQPTLPPHWRHTPLMSNRVAYGYGTIQARCILICCKSTYPTCVNCSSSHHLPLSPRLRQPPPPFHPHHSLPTHTHYQITTTPHHNTTAPLQYQQGTERRTQSDLCQRSQHPSSAPSPQPPHPTPPPTKHK